MGSRPGTCAGYLANPFLKQAIDMTSHSVGLAGGAKDQDRHALNGTRHASKGVLGEPTMVKGSLRNFGMGGLHQKCACACRDQPLFFM